MNPGRIVVDLPRVPLQTLVQLRAFANPPSFFLRNSSIPPPFEADVAHIGSEIKLVP
jgi:hypothetical protein